MEQKWFGWIEEINDKSFDVRLKDLSNNGTDEETTILIEEISDDDKKIIMLGSTFHWTINDNGSNIEFVEQPSEEESKRRYKIAENYYKSMRNSTFFDD